VQTDEPQSARQGLLLFLPVRSAAVAFREALCTPAGKGGDALARAMLCALVSAVAVSLASSACSEETTYRKHIKPLFDAKCGRCHGSDSAPELGAYKEEKDVWVAKDKGMRMDTYSHLIFYTAWPDTGALMRRLDDGKSLTDGKPGNMHLHLGAAPRNGGRTSRCSGPGSGTGR